jgi:class 3 adenylate cyclase
MSQLPPAYFLDPNLLLLVGMRIVTMSLRYGNSPESASGYVLFGLGLGAALGRYQSGHSFGQLAVDLTVRYPDVSVRAKTLVIFGGFVNFWSRPIASSLEILKEAHATAVNAGDFQYANYAALASIFLQFAQGVRLDRFVANCNHYKAFVEQTRDAFAIDGLSFYQQAALSLQAAGGSQARLLTTDATEDVLIDRLLSSRNLTTIGYFYTVRLMLEYLLGNHGAALAYARKAQPYIRSLPGQIQVAEHCFYGALAASALLGGDHPTPGRLRSLVRGAARRMRSWARNCPENFEPRALLLEAEVQRAAGQLRDAVELYDRAISAARERDLSNVAAVACERAADACRVLRYERLMRTYLFEARQFYSRWGAIAKVGEIERRGGVIMVVEAGADDAQHGGPPQEERRARASSHPDAEVVGDIAHAIAGGIDEKRLLTRMMTLVLRHSGAARGWFVSNAANGYTIEAAIVPGDVDVLSPHGRPLPEAPGICAEVLNLAARTKREVLVVDAHTDPRFAHLPVVRESALRSLLCVPVLRQRDVVGLLYLDNDLAPGVFTADRLRVTQMIAGELAMAIENSRIYHDLKEKNVALRSALEKLEVLSNIKAQLAKFVPHEVERIIDENPMSPAFEFRNEDVSVLFLDIEGYTRLTEALPHQDMNYLVERYFSTFLDDINQNGGDVSATMGDGLVIVFQDADPRRHAERAVHAAISMQANAARLNRELTGNYPAITINIGVNSGPASLGPSRIEGATGVRWSYAAWGTVTNVAARIGALASGGDILISEETRARVVDQCRLESLGKQQFKNVSRAVTVYRVLDEEPQPAPLAEVEVV